MHYFHQIENTCMLHEQAMVWKWTETMLFSSRSVDCQLLLLIFKIDLYLPTPCQYEFTITTASGCNFSRNPFSIVQCPDNGESLITQTFDHYSLFAGGLSNNAKRIRSGAISKQQKTCLTTEGKEKSTSRSFWFWLLSACSKVLLLQWTRIWPCRLCQTWSSIWQLHWVIIL